MTVAPESTGEMCRAGLHSTSGEGSRRHKGRMICRACESSSAEARNERVRVRMRQLIVGFAYRPKTVWRDRAACEGVDPELFEYVDSDSGVPTYRVTALNNERHEAARLWCEVCPVVAQCLGEALMNEDVGTRGGELLTPNDWKRGRMYLEEIEP